VLVEEGDARAGLLAAERALSLDPGDVDGLAAACSACAALARFQDAQSYWLRLFRADYEEAHALRERLGAADILSRDDGGSIPPSSSESGAQDLWDPLEVGLTRGERAALLSDWEKRTRRFAEAQGYEPRQSNIRANAEEAARCLSLAPGFTHFGPFDFSLHSLTRLEVALDLVYGVVPGLAASGSAIWLIAAYIGESLRHAYDGGWHLDDATPYDGKVVTKKGQFSVFREVDRRLRLGSPLGIEDFIDVRSEQKGPEWRARRDLVVQAPVPWGEKKWPSVAEVERIGRAMPYSVVSLYCKHYGGAPLDGTLSTLSALNRYLELIAPPMAPVRELDPLLTRTGLFVGSYVGEVLRKSLGGFWQKPSTPPLMKDSDLGASDYVVMAGRVATRPIAQVLERLAGVSHKPIIEYVLSVRDQHED
jgi:hypothetical protein